MKEWTTVTIPSHPQYLSLVRAVTVKMGELYGMGGAATEDVKLAVDEACSNVIKHAYRGETDKKIVVKFRIIRKGFEVIIEDKGLKAYPELIEGRSLNDVRPGGLGVHLIKRAFDVVVFDDKRKKGNRLRLIRFRKKEDGD